MFVDSQTWGDQKGGPSQVGGSFAIMLLAADSIDNNSSTISMSSSSSPPLPLPLVRAPVDENATERSKRWSSWFKHRRHYSMHQADLASTVRMVEQE